MDPREAVARCIVWWRETGEQPWRRYKRHLPGDAAAALVDTLHAQGLYALAAAACDCDRCTGAGLPGVPGARRREATP